MRRFAAWLNWRIVLPWSIGLLGIYAAAHFVLAWAIQREVIRSGESRVGARVEVGSTRVDLAGGRIALSQIHVANPQSPLRNLVEAERCALQLERSALLQKRAIVQFGSVTGLRFCTSREATGALPGVDVQANPAIEGWLDETAIEQAQKWLDQLHHCFDRDLVDQLESIRLAEELLARWPAESAAIDQRVLALRNRAAEFHAKIRDAQENPLRHVDFLRRLPKEVTAVREEIAFLTTDVVNLPNLAVEDRRAIVAAREHDEQLIRESLHFEPIDTNVLSAYLLQQQLSGPLADVVGWVRFVRRLVPAETSRSNNQNPLHRRGREIFFTGCKPSPDLLVRQLQLEGTAELGSQPIAFLGTVCDLASQPERHNQPIRLQLSTRGALPLEVQATIDRTQTIPRDRIVIECGGVALPKLSLGRSNKLRLSLAPSTASVIVTISLEGEKLSGDVQVVQHQVEITPAVGEELVRCSFDSELSTALGDVDTIETRISLSGTLERPQSQVWSSLGPAVADALNRALVETTAAYTRRILTESHRRVDERLAELDRTIAETQAAFEPQIEDATDSLDQLNKKIAGQRLSADQVGRRLPTDSLFR